MVGVRVVGVMQLYSKDRGVSQVIEGYAEAFTELMVQALYQDSLPSYRGGSAKVWKDVNAACIERKEFRLAQNVRTWGCSQNLAILYARYRPERMMEHLGVFCLRVNIPGVITACEEAHLWTELDFLYVHYDEYDNAIITMMKHSPVAWEHGASKEVVLKVSI
ncbi:hypothetical protein BGZ49_007832 [Haplosporangium sp. Z 27]|nr:hypothetical protein BGZ49_007832 [Haplosporangium sp. Z 27]